MICFLCECLRAVWDLITVKPGVRICRECVRTLNANFARHDRRHKYERTPPEDGEPPRVA